MLINIIKYIHLLCVLGLLGSVFYCIASTHLKSSSADEATFPTIIVNKTIIWLSLAGMMTGTLLIYPKHFTFHTPWIQAAYILITIFIVSAHLLKRISKTKTLTSTKQFLLTLGYIGLVIILIFIIHDAVTKTTVLL